VVPGKRSEPKVKVLAGSAGTMENEYLKVRIADDGSLTVRDKRTGRTFRNLNVFEDVGEVGEAGWHRSPQRDLRITSRGGKASVRLERTDSFSATYRIDVKLVVPAKASPDKKSRSRQKTTLAISSRVTLREGAGRVDAVTKVDNRVKDHRLRALFPSGIRTETAWAGGQFDVVGRPLVTYGGKCWIEEEIPNHPNYGFVDLTDGKTGLAILNEGLTEYEVLRDRQRTVALTLLRCVQDICGVPAAENMGGQCRREFEFRYAIYPHAGDYQRGNVFQEAQDFHLPLEPTQSGRGGPAGDEMSFFSLDPSTLILSAFKRSENGRSVILRFFNPTLKKVQATVACFRRIKRAWETNLNEQRLKVLKPKTANTVTMVARPKKIVTVEIVLDGG